MDTLSVRELRVHIPVVAWLMLIGHLFLVLGALFVFLLLAGVGVAVGEAEATPILLTVGTLVGGFLAVLAAPGLAAGLGLLARRPWARVLAIVVAILGLINIPLGTLTGAYTVWVLLQDAATDYFAPAPPAS